MLTLKLTDEQMAKIGATTAEEAIGALDKIGELRAERNALINEKVAMKTEIESIQERLKAAESKIEAIGKPVDIEALRKEILAEADKNLCAYVAKIGAQALPNKETPPDVSAGDKKEVAADDYKGQWEASEDLRAEFLSFESYVAFKRASDEGRVRVCKHTN